MKVPSWISKALGKKKQNGNGYRRIYKGNVPILNESGEPVNITTKPEKFPNNEVITSRYNLWNFIPKTLYEQFRRVVNFYFLAVVLLQAFTDSPVSPATTLGALVFVLSVTALKQGYEDWLRHRNDDKVNNKPVTIISNGTLKNVKAKDVRVGDFVKLVKDEQVPTDLLLLGSSDEYLRCEITTVNLDGETNLKLKYCPTGLPHLKKAEYFKNLHLIVECEQPSESLYDFHGSLLIPSENLKELDKLPRGSISVDRNDAKNSTCRLQQEPIDLESSMIPIGQRKFLSIPLSMDNMVLRGTKLKTTEFIYGIVIYSGRDTRLAKNSEKSGAKFSTAEKAVNYYLAFFVLLLGLMVLFSSLMQLFVDWEVDEIEIDEEPWYLFDGDDENSTVDVINIVSAFIVLYNYIIPVSLYVTIELQKFMGSKFFQWDKEMMDDEGNGPVCNTSDLNEELGQIQYLFSDKTGTLTKNLMKFRCCSVDGSCYDYKIEEKALLKKDNEKQVDVLENEKMVEFFKTLALCHSVQVMHTEANTSPEYLASSPDEKALLEACQNFGIVYNGEKDNVMTVEVMGKTEKFKRLVQLEFDADRKCMSVIVENCAGEIWVLTKGAESTVIPKCDEGPKEETLKHIMDYALIGLRTLAVSVRKLTREQYDTFDNELRVSRRNLQEREEKIREVFNKIESQMTLIGATGVEDQLEDFVPETLQSLAEAGIRVWMLTGDKLETGVNVALSCGLITASTKQFILGAGFDDLKLEEILIEMRQELKKSENTCFVIDGDRLTIALKECPALLQEVAVTASCVVCCRLAPLQKAQVVEMVKNSPGRPTTCAVGDGANDCAMIQAAHVGIGIIGKEGRQAARTADFALGKFGFLRRAILVHGHWYYDRLGNLANYFFYKNVVFVFPQLWFAFHTNFSAQALFTALMLMNYNIFFSSCPILFFGLMEQKQSAEVLLQNPALYKKNDHNRLMTVWSFSPWFIASIWHSIVCYFVPYFSWNNFQNMNDIYCLGITVSFAIVMTTNNKMAIQTKYISWWYLLTQIICYATFMIIFGVYCEVIQRMGINAGGYHHVLFTLMSSFEFWLLMIFVGICAAVPDLLHAFVQNNWEETAGPFQRLYKGKMKEK